MGTNVAAGTATLAINSAIDHALADMSIVGAVVLVAQDGQIVYRRAAGLADRERAIPMREQAVFRLASLTKLFVAAAALRLVELGKISLADPVTRFLPAFRPTLASGEAPTIILRQLLTHTAGLSYGFLQPLDGPYHLAGVSDGMDQPGLSMAEELNRIGSAGLIGPPGERWAYSVAMDVLGAVMEVVEGRSLDAVVAEHVTAPLKLVATGFDLTVERRDMLVTPYSDGIPGPVCVPDSGQRVRFPDSVPVYAGLAGVNLVPGRVFDRSSYHSGGSGMVGTADDMLALIEAISRGGSPILTRNTAAAMMTVQTGDFPIPNRGPGWAFGFGGGVLTDPAAAQSPQSPGTLGWGGVWGNAWFVDPVRRLTVVSLTNTALEGMMGRFARDLRSAVYADPG